MQTSEILQIGVNFRWCLLRTSSKSSTSFTQHKYCTQSVQIFHTEFMYEKFFLTCLPNPWCKVWLSRCYQIRGCQNKSDCLHQFVLEQLDGNNCLNQLGLIFHTESVIQTRFFFLIHMVLRDTKTYSPNIQCSMAWMSKYTYSTHQYKGGYK